MDEKHVEPEMNLREQILELEPQSVLRWQVAALNAGYTPQIVTPPASDWRRVATFDGIEVGQLDNDHRILAKWSEGNTHWEQELPLNIAWDWNLISDPREN